MEENILLSKIVATPTESTWCQAYSTLNLYVVLSKKSHAIDESIVSSGKELLERIQREYFSLDQKDLKNIKKSVEAAVGEKENLDSVSIVLVTITQKAAYIVIAGAGNVVLKRGAKIGVIAEGVAGEINAFSGELAADDILILETTDFSKKITVDKLSGLLDHNEVSAISENIAPLVHDEAQGTEAAIVLQYKTALGAKSAVEEIPEEEATVKAEDKTKAEPLTETVQELPGKNIRLPKISIPKNLLSFKNKWMIIAVIVILAALLGGSIFMERSKQEAKIRQTILAEILTPAEKKFDEANALLNLNKGLALEEFNQIKGGLETNQGKLAAGTAERKKLDEFIGKVEGKIGELAAGSTLSNQKLIYDKDADFVDFKENTLSVVKKDTGEINLLSSTGSSEKTIDTKNKNVATIALDTSSIYVLGDLGVTKSDKKSGKTTNPIDDIKNTVELDTFGANLYGLNTSTKTVDRYVGGAGARSAYFKGDVTLADPTSMAIDGSIWILDGGKIRKFTKGTEDTFTLSGLTKEISTDSQVTTAPDYSSIYILDNINTRIISIAKNGEVKNQYVSRELANASSFTVDEPGKKIYVVISNKLYSFDL